MTHLWIKFFECFDLLCVLGALVMLAPVIIDLYRGYPRSSATGRRPMRSLSSIGKSGRRLSATCILWAAAAVCQMAMVNGAGERLFWTKLGLWFLAMSLCFMQTPRIARYIRRKRFTQDRKGVLRLSN